MTICPYCGAENEDGQFCVSCGMDLNAPTYVPNPAAAQGAGAASPEAPAAQAAPSAQAAPAAQADPTPQPAPTPQAAPAAAPAQPAAPAPQGPNWPTIAIVALIGVAVVAAVLLLSPQGGTTGGGTSSDTVEATAETVPEAPSEPAPEAPAEPAPTAPADTASGLSPATFSWDWVGYFGGTDSSGTTVQKDISMTFYAVEDDGYLFGVCTVATDGSYYVDGYVDWATGSISLYAGDWEHQGGLRVRRNFSGTVSQAGDSITGSCEASTGGYGSEWRMFETR